MIFIDKPKAEPNISVFKEANWNGAHGKVTLAERDLERAIAYYGDPANFKDNVKLTTEKAKKFEAYCHPETKAELKAVFKSKCAYCESMIAHIEPGDIEHFRPKAEVLVAPGNSLIPGYYWLAAKWDNLLLSCTNCNRPNNQTINTPDGNLVLMGKANLFPLSNESKRIRRHTQRTTTEDPFVELINPCNDAPGQHLEFKSNGEVHPLTTKGQKSIEVYGLFRADLVHQRKLSAEGVNEHLKLLSLEIKDLALKIQHHLSLDLSLEKIESYTRLLRSALHPTAEYLGLKRTVVREFIEQNPVTYQKLKNWGVDLDILLA